MKIDDLPEKLAEAVRYHIPLAEQYYYHRQDGALDSCVEASGDFVETLERFGFKSGDALFFMREYILYADSPADFEQQKKNRDLELFPFDGEEWRFHFANKVDGFIIDWTARQFDRDAPFPAIWREP